MKKKRHKVILIIMDGWGTAPTIEGNAINQARTPIYNTLIKHCPHSLLYAAGSEVGLMWGERGNSEVGHMNLGAGRVAWQDLARVTQSIMDQSFFNNSSLVSAMTHVKKNNSGLHLIGLVSTGGVHSHLDHLIALLDLAQKYQVSRVYIHMFTDGRDTPPRVAHEFIKKLHQRFWEKKFGWIATVSGRYYAMDRDNHWERTKLAAEAILDGKGIQTNSPKEAINQAYLRGESDEFIRPTVITFRHRPIAQISNNDAIIFFNIRADRTGQIVKLILAANRKNIFFATMTDYNLSGTMIAYPAVNLNKILAEEISASKLTQLHIAETEKYAHVTYFFNCGQENPFPGEKRILVPSPRVPTYDLRPEMSAAEVTQKLVAIFPDLKPDFTVLNFANSDMVGHTGNINATIDAVETVDFMIGEIIEKLLSDELSIIITADHGNAEQMINPKTNEIDKEHTINPVPLIIITNPKIRQLVSANPEDTSPDEKMKVALQTPNGVLADVAPTILDLMQVDKPQEMLGQSLVEYI
jgi:2,3-bisphosphoglycerate-independent phosphoglycerate mutase